MWTKIPLAKNVPSLVRKLNTGAEPLSACVFSMPLTTLIRAVPCGSEIADGFEVSTLGVRTLAFGVVGDVSSSIHEGKVVDVVVEWVLVNVVDNGSVRDGAVVELPDLAVE